MEFLYLLEKIRNPVFDFFFSVITHLGDETAFLLIAILLFWCVSKRGGYYVMISGFFGTIVNQTMKLIFKAPRPWQIDSKFTIVESAREAATGYSFPSGHTQSAVSTAGSISFFFKKKWLAITLSVIALLVAFSRLYLGVHTPWDVLGAIGCALIIVIVLEPFFADEEKMNRAMPYILGILTALSLGFFIYAMYISTPDTNANTVSAAKNACTMLGCALGAILVYCLDRLVIKFETGARWYSQIIKLALGIGIIFLIKTFLKIPLEAWLGSYYERLIRYFVIVGFAGAVWPLTFGLFARLRIPVLDRFGNRVLALFGKAPKEELAPEEKKAAPTIHPNNKKPRRKKKK